jgi:hypothetical protein
MKSAWAKIFAKPFTGYLLAAHSIAAPPERHRGDRSAGANTGRYLDARA